MAATNISAVSVRSINECASKLKPIGYWHAAPEILKSVRAYPADASERDREADGKQVGNALIVWLIAAKEIQEDSGPQPEPDFLRRALDQLGKRVAVCAFEVTSGVGLEVHDHFGDV
jgi:hypothetical protein